MTDNIDNYFAEIDAVVDTLPAEQAEKIMQAAAEISGRQDMNQYEAAYFLLDVFGNRQIYPEIEAEFDRIDRQVSAAGAWTHWQQLTDEQREQMRQASNNGEIAQLVIELCAQIKQRRQDAQEVERQHMKHESITVDFGTVDPTIDPLRPEFDPDALKQAIENKTMDGAVAQVRQEFVDMSARIGKSFMETLDTTAAAGKLLAERAEAVITTLQTTLQSVTAFINSDAYKAIKENMAALGRFIAEHQDEIRQLAEATQEVQDLAPYLAIELKEMQKDPAFADCTLQDLIEQGFDDAGNPIDSPFLQAIERAKKRRAEYEDAENIIVFAERTAGEIPQVLATAERPEDLPRIISQTTDLLHYPLDKPNSVIWNLLTSADPNGQVAMNLRTSKKGSKQDAIVYYSISFDEIGSDLKITKQLTPFDKRVYIAAAALFNAGNSIMSATQIYKMMGNSGQPKAEQIQKINDSITKMGAARVYLDSTEEVKVNKKYSGFKYDASLLPFERIGAYINNTLTESAIHLFREPPIITFARERGQITGITRQLLESPISKTDANLLLEDYLLERIGHMKNPKGKAPRKMLFATIYEKCGIKTRNQRSRAPEKIRRYLDHYKACGFIAGYTEDAEGITIQL